MRRKHLPKDLKGAGGVPNCAVSVAFSRLWVLRRPKLRLRSARPSKSQRSRSRFHWRHAQKQPTRNTVAKKQAGQEDVDSTCLFVEMIARPRVAPFMTDYFIPKLHVYRCLRLCKRSC